MAFPLIPWLPFEEDAVAMLGLALERLRPTIENLRGKLAAVANNSRRNSNNNRLPHLLPLTGANKIFPQRIMIPMIVILESPTETIVSVSKGRDCVPV